jgi:hypothetical protein
MSMTGIKFLRKDAVPDHTKYLCREANHLCYGQDCPMVLQDDFPRQGFFCELTGISFWE